MPVLREVYLAAEYAANLEVLLKGAVDLLHQGQGVRFKTGPGVRAEVCLVVLLEVYTSLRPVVDQGVWPGVIPVVHTSLRPVVDQEVRFDAVIPIVMLGVVVAALREAVQ